MVVLGHEGKVTSAVLIHNAGILVGKCSKTENVDN
jgi:hypothetical protein